MKPVFINKNAFDMTKGFVEKVSILSQQSRDGLHPPHSIPPLPREHFIEEDSEDDRRLDRLVFGVPQSQIETELESVIRVLKMRLNVLSETHQEHVRSSNDLVTLSTDGRKHDFTREMKKKSRTGSVGGKQRDKRNAECLKSSEEGVLDAQRLVFLTKPSTETSRRLEQRLEEVHDLVSNRDVKSSKMKSKQQRKEGQEIVIDAQRSEAKRLVRLKLEKDLQANMEAFMTRSVTESSMIFRAPVNFDEQPSWPISIRWPSPHPLHTSVSNNTGEMSPDILLLYALERVNIHAGYKMFRSLLRHPSIISMYVHLFWLCKIRFFQLSYQDSDELWLSQNLSKDYSVIMSFVFTLAKAEYEKDYVFRFLPFILANAIHFGFYYLCPGSRHLLTRGFRKSAVVFVMQFMFGVKISPLAMKALWVQMFPDDLATEEDDKGKEDSFRPLNQEQYANTSVNKSAGNAMYRSHGDEHSIEGCHDRALCSSASSSVDNVFSPYGGTRNKSTLLRESTSAVADNLVSRMTDFDIFSGSVVSSAASLMQSKTATIKPTLLRQKTDRFNLQALSPLIRNYYATSELTHGNSVQLVKISAPVSNCLIGGTDTYKRKSLSGTLCDDIAR